MKKRTCTHIGSALLLLPVLAAVILQVCLGKVVSFGPVIVTSVERTSILTTIISEVDAVPNWPVVLPLLLVTAAGCALLWFGSRVAVSPPPLPPHCRLPPDDTSKDGE